MSVDSVIKFFNHTTDFILNNLTSSISKISLDSFQTSGAGAVVYLVNNNDANADKIQLEPKYFPRELLLKHINNDANETARNTNMEQITRVLDNYDPKKIGILVVFFITAIFPTPIPMIRLFKIQI